MIKPGRKKLEGFSLIEISIVLLIFGIIAGGMLKGKDLIETAQIRSVASDIQNLQTVFSSYINSYSAIPGDDGSATERFGEGIESGDGDGEMSEADAKKVFNHLFAAGLIDSKDFKKSKIGGKYDIIAEEGVAKLRISNSGKAVLSKRQTIALIAKINETLGETEGLIQTEPKLSSSSSAKYIVKIPLNAS